MYARERFRGAGLGVEHGGKLFEAVVSGGAFRRRRDCVHGAFGGGDGGGARHGNNYGEGAGGFGLGGLLTAGRRAIDGGGAAVSAACVASASAGRVVLGAGGRTGLVGGAC